MAELKPCPFCGGTEIVIQSISGIFPRSSYQRTYKYIQCRSCFAMTADYATKPKAIEAWNRRVDNGRIR